MTDQDRLKLANDILSSDDASLCEDVLMDFMRERPTSDRERRMADVISALYKVIHPAGGCNHPDWDSESLKKL